MIDNTLGSMAAVMAAVWMLVQFFKRIPLFAQVSQIGMAVVLGQALGLVAWQNGLLKMDGAPLDGDWRAWSMAVVYLLIATAATATAHETGQDPAKLLKRIKKGKALR